MQIDEKTDKSGPNVALIGYARISTGDQKLALQHDALNAAGCERIFDDHASGAKTDRPGLAEALAYRLCCKNSTGRRGAVALTGFRWCRR